MIPQFIKYTTAFVITGVLAACGQQSLSPHQEHEKHVDSSMHQVQHHRQAVNTVVLKDDRLTAVYRQYEQLTNALVNDDLKNARIAGNAIAAGMHGVEGGEAVKNTAVKVTEATDITALRAAYAALNNALIEKVKRTGLATGELYVDFCPMALDDKGAYWMSAEKEIRNPYMGAQMLTCGEVKDSIK